MYARAAICACCDLRMLQYARAAMCIIVNPQSKTQMQANQGSKLVHWYSPMHN